MLEKRFIFFFVVLIIAIGCAQSGKVVEADEKDSFPRGWGTSRSECILLEEGLSIKIARNNEDRCADVVVAYKSNDCSQGKIGEIYPEKSKEGSKLPIPVAAFSGAGNQLCQEAIVAYQNSPFCFQYTSGGRTRYIPRG